MKHDLSKINLYQRNRLTLKLRRHRNKLIAVFIFLLFILFYVFGVFFLPFELDFDTNFHYPLYASNFRYLIDAAKKQVFDEDYLPINNYSYLYYLNPVQKCLQQAQNGSNKNLLYPTSILLVVKSATCNFILRSIIRQSWGDENRFSDVNIRTVFMLGNCTKNCPNSFIDNPSLILSRKSNQFRSLLIKNQTLNCQQLIDIENEFYGDIVQANFIDSYYNNTLKTMALLQWTAKYCSWMPFFLFVDDDYYVSIKNLLKYLKPFVDLQKREYSPNVNQNSKNGEENNKVDNDLKMDDNANDELSMLKFGQPLFTGFLFSHSRPQRHLPSKWFVNLEEYPYNRYPPYITGGCYLVNNHTLIDLYYASLFTKPFKYDDIYLGILANKLNIPLMSNNALMHFYKLSYDKMLYQNIISSHGYKDPQELWQVWNEQKSLGSA